MSGIELELQCLLGMKCNDFTILAVDQTHTHGIIVMKNDELKLHKINDKMMMGVIGSLGDSKQFTQYLIKNLQLYKMRNKYELDTPAVVHFTRKSLSDAWKTGTPSIINMMIAAYDERKGGQLYSLDVLGTCVEVPFASHGLGGILSMGIMDRYHMKNLKVSEAYDILKLCVMEIHEKLLFNLPNFQVKVVSKRGIMELPVINTASYITTK